MHPSSCFWVMVTRWEYEFLGTSIVLGNWEICRFYEVPEPADPPVIATTTLSAGVVGQPYSTTLLTDDGRAGNWTIYSGSLPAGLTLSVSGAISGTPTMGQTAAATFRFTDLRIELLIEH